MSFRPETNNHFILFIWLVIVIVMLFYLFKFFKVQTDISVFLPSQANQLSVAMQHQLQHGDANKMILIAIQSRSKDIDSKLLANLNKRLTSKLQQSNRFDVVQNGQANFSSIIIQPFFDYRFLLHRQTESVFSSDYLSQSFQQLLQRLQLLLSPIEQKLFAEDPQSLWISILKQWQTENLTKYQDVWFDEHKQRTFLYLKTKAPGYDLEQQQININFIQSKINSITDFSFSQNNQLKTKHSPEIEVIMTGAPIFALSSRESIRFQIQIISALASIILFVFLLIIFRSIKVVLLMSLPLGFAILAGLTTVIATFGFIHGITIAFGITIIGIAVDYPLHFYSHRLLTKQSNNQQIIDTIWPKLRLGLITTLIGLTALTLSNFPGLNQLGLFAISGLLAAALMTRFVLPQINFILPNTSISKLKPITLPSKLRVKYLVIVILALPILSFIIALTNSGHIWQTDLSALSPVPETQKQQDAQLRQSLGVAELRYALIAQHDDIETLLQAQEALLPQLYSLQQQGVLSGFDMAALYLPSVKHQQTLQQDLPGSNVLQQQINSLLNVSDLDPLAFKPFIEAVTQAKSLVPLTLKELSKDTFLTPKNRLIIDKINQLLYQDTQTGLWYCIIPLKGVQTDTLQQMFISKTFLKTNPVDWQFLDIKTETEQLLKDYRQEATSWFLLGCVLIIMTLWFSKRSLSQSLELAWPFLGAVLLTIASLLLLGKALSLFHLVTLLLVVGLGIDYSIFTHSTSANSCKLKQDNKQNITDVAQISVIICLISTLIMFGALATSDLPVLNAIGLTAFLGALYAFLLTICMSHKCH